MKLYLVNQKSSRTYASLHKTMGAGILVNEEEPDRHKIDCSGVVIKYIGETEKTLNKVFLKAWPKNLMLFIDGGDLLMGKRSTVNHEGGTF